MKYLEVRNCVYSNAEQTQINCEVLFETLGSFIQFTATSTDEEEHGKEIFSRAASGEFGEVAPFVETALTQDQKIASAKQYLASTDWVEPYLIRHELQLSVLPATSNKLLIAQKRAEARAILQ